MRIEQIQTPALVVDLNVLEQNQRTMNDLVANCPAKLRPHYKSNKCTAIAHKQIAAGAKGVTCAKLGEARDLVESGIEDVLIANQITDLGKIAEVARLAGCCRLSIAVDGEKNIRDLEAAAAIQGTHIYCLVEYEIGMGRCGVTTKEDLLVLAQLIDSCPHLTFEGIQAYAGHLSHEADVSLRSELGAGVEARLKEAKAYLEEHGLTVPQVSGCSTASVRDHAIPDTVYTEFQPGSYLFMDAAYRPLADLPFRNSLFVLATVMSKGNGKTITDAGMKAVSVDQLPPVFLGYEDYPVELSEEHGAVLLPEDEKQVGDKMWLIPSHCCTCINIYDWLYFVRDGKVEDKVPINSRGKSI